MLLSSFAAGKVYCATKQSASPYMQVEDTSI
jgi:hypothetical protein